MRNNRFTPNEVLSRFAIVYQLGSYPMRIRTLRSKFQTHALARRFGFHDCVDGWQYRVYGSPKCEL